MERLYEQLSAVFNIITMAGTSAFIFLRESFTPSGAFGPCIALSRDDYFAVGGHAVVRNSVLENLALGRLFARQGRPVNCYGGKGTIRFRMYADGFKSLFEGFSKGFATGANIISPLVLILSIAWIVGGISVSRHLLQALVLVQTAEIFLWLVFYLLFSAQIYWMLLRIGNFKIMTAIFYPIPLLFFVVVFIWSMVLTFVLRRANWKQRKISIDSTGKTS
jgi:4,4'-diaponeurosporenoate glycosyltransferase